MGVEQVVEKRSAGLARVWALFVAFSVLFALVVFGLRLAEDAVQSAWLLIMLCVAALSVALLVKELLPQRRQVWTSCALGLLVLVAGLGGSAPTNVRALTPVIVTVLSALAMFSVFNRYPGNAMPLLAHGSPARVVGTVATGVFVGVVLGALNLLLSDQQLALRISPSAFLVALNPAIHEEIAFRACIFAFCVYSFKGAVHTRGQRFTLWFMMVVPHAMVHAPQVFIDSGVVSGVVNTLVLAVLFGLPFAILQRRRGVASAMIAHGVVDIIRFLFVGLPS